MILSKRAKDDTFEFEVIEPMTEEITFDEVLEEVPATRDLRKTPFKEEETKETDTLKNIEETGGAKSAPHVNFPSIDVDEPIELNDEEIETILREFEAGLKIKEMVKTARRRGVKEEYIWMFANGRLYVDKNVEKEKELSGVVHAKLADRAGVSPKHEYPRGFVTYNEDGSVEVQTYGVSFWEMPSQLQDRVERWFDLKPGQYKVERPLELPPGTTLYASETGGLMTKNDAKAKLLERMTDVCDLIDAHSDMYLGDIMSDCISSVSAGNFVTAPLQLRKLGNILDKRGLFDLAEEVDSLLPDILELKASMPNTNTQVKHELSAQKAYKTAKKLYNMYMCGDVDENSFEYDKMKELKALLKSGFTLPSDNGNVPSNVRNWWEHFEE